MGGAPSPYRRADTVASGTERTQDSPTILGPGVRHPDSAPQEHTGSTSFGPSLQTPASSPSGHGVDNPPVARPTTLLTTVYALGREDVPADLILVSSDDILFHVHQGFLQNVSENEFGGLLPLSPAQHSAPPDQHSSPRVPLSERAEVTEIMLYAIYALSFAFTSHSFSALVEACNGLRKYGVPPAHSLSPTSPLYAVVMAFAQTRPMEAYAVAAENDAFALARACSQHLIAFDLVNIDDRLFERLGPIYFSKLFVLQKTRLEALKGRLRSTPRPRPHPQSSLCTSTDQEKLESAWMSVAGDLVYEKRIDLTVDGLRTTLEPLGEHLSCEICVEALAEAVADLVRGWPEVVTEIW